MTYLHSTDALPEKCAYLPNFSKISMHPFAPAPYRKDFYATLARWQNNASVGQQKTSEAFVASTSEVCTLVWDCIKCGVLIFAMTRLGRNMMICTLSDAIIFVFPLAELPLPCYDMKSVRLPPTFSGACGSSETPPSLLRFYYF